MTTPSPCVTIDLACRSVLEYAQLLPSITGPRSLFVSGPLRQLDKDCGRRFELRVVPYDLSRAKIELDLECEKFADAMARSPAIATRIKSILEQADVCDDPVQIASMIQQIRDVGGNFFLAR